MSKLFLNTFVLLLLISTFACGKRTAHSVARIHTGLEIPDKATVVLFNEQWNDFNGDGDQRVILEIPDRYMPNLIDQAIKKGYRENDSSLVFRKEEFAKEILTVTLDKKENILSIQYIVL